MPRIDVVVVRQAVDDEFQPCKDFLARVTNGLIRSQQNGC